MVIIKLPLMEDVFHVLIIARSVAGRTIVVVVHQPIIWLPITDVWYVVFHTVLVVSQVGKAINALFACLVTTFLTQPTLNV
jgi:hypothetical protein